MKPKSCATAYQFWEDHKRMYTKPAGVHSGGTWTNRYANEYPGNCNLFVWGYDTGHKKGDRMLIHLRGVDACGGPSDGEITNGVTTLEEALNLAKASEKTDIAYTWHAPSQRFIEKPPSKDAGFWRSDEDCDFFMWADELVEPATPEEIEAAEKERAQDEI